MTQLADLQSWGQCSLCEMNLWIVVSPNEQRCACNCGAVSLHDGDKIRPDWADVSDADFQAIVDADIAVGMAP